MNSNSFGKFSVVIKSQSHMTRITKDISEGHLERISNTFWSNCEHFILTLFIGHCVTLV